jgi:hypothetical protein
MMHNRRVITFIIGGLLALAACSSTNATPALTTTTPPTTVAIAPSTESVTAGTPST